VAGSHAEADHPMTTTKRQAHRECMRRWAQAKTIADLGQLGALWLEGAIPSQPGYEQMCGPDPETANLVPVLARLNRAGFFTCGSQPGVMGDHWQQRAAVDGFISDPDLFASIVAAMAARADDVAGLWMIRYDSPSRWRNDYRSARPVTQYADEDYTWFGARLSRRCLRFLYGETGALDALYGAWQVTVIDEVWGRDDELWAALDEAIS